MPTLSKLWIPEKWESTLVKNGNSLALNVPAFIRNKANLSLGQRARITAEFEHIDLLPDDGEEFGLVMGDYLKSIFPKIKHLFPAKVESHTDNGFLCDVNNALLFRSLAQLTGISFQDIIKREKESHLYDAADLERIVKIDHIIQKKRGSK